MPAAADSTGTEARRYGPRPRCPPGVLASAAFAFALALAAGAQSPDRVLVQIDRLQPGRVDADTVAGVVPLQELRTGWIAEATDEVVTRLEARGVRLRVLDDAPARRAHFLALSAGPAELAALATLGTVTPLEDGLVFVATAHADLRPLAPPAVSISRLPATAHLALRFDVAGVAHAVPRAGLAPAARALDDRIAQAVAAVSPERLQAHIRSLESFQTRYASTANCESAGVWIDESFRGLGLETATDAFTFGSKPYDTSNIVATIPGRTLPDQIVIMCAHYDSYSTQAATRAPGADDNASGTAALLEAARVLAAAPLDFTVRLIAFSAEEWGLYGSRHYAQEARQRGEQIVGVVNLDMIAYADHVPEDVDLAVNPASDWLGDRFVADAGAYVAGLPVRKQVNPSVRGSDHAPFWDQGYAALLAIDDYPVTNPYYHTTVDTSETLDMDFAVSVARAAIATLADLAQPVNTPAPPARLAATSQTSMSLFASGLSVALTWDDVAGAAGYHVYRAASSHGPYRRVTVAPVTSTSFIDRLVSVARPGSGQGSGAPPPVYYVVTAVDPGGRESNYSAEVAK